MNDAARVEVKEARSKEVGKILQYVPRQEARWREGVVQHVQKVEPSFTQAQATPPATQPVQNSEDLKEVKAVRVDAEPIINTADVEHLGNTLKEMVFGGITHIRTTGARGPDSTVNLMSRVKSAAKAVLKKAA